MVHDEHDVDRNDHHCLDEDYDLNHSLTESVLSMEEVKKLVYLHGALCEVLRLFPPVPIERKQAIEADTLPSGHRVNANTMIMFSLYAMGRSEEIWGKDYLEFKPERWISERGEIAYMHQLTNSLLLMQDQESYRFQVVEDHVATPGHSIILLMKNGLKARILKRQV
ncbi:unnamed protein product [Sphenostylis stenocarpa]|uniref:Cytochrome P450 n=1 Tax=Sphenostylis stenocarpa TaxID=92480 RepID=A0AA86SMR1_9FABA|nr:unnamed protein product [Sphenostylis stenocarpa]